MIVKVLGKTISKEYVALLLCVFVLVNAVQGTVLCYGADGHVEFESAFHEQHTDHDHFRSAAHGHHCPEAEHDENKRRHLGQCVDVPVDFGLVQISRTSEKLDRAFAVIYVDAILAIEQLSCLESGPASNAFFATCYFSPLSTVILMV